jgi:hypothetical protein
MSLTEYFIVFLTVIGTAGFILAALSIYDRFNK